MLAVDRGPKEALVWIFTWLLCLDAGDAFFCALGSLVPWGLFDFLTPGLGFPAFFLVWLFGCAFERLSFFFSAQKR